MRGLSKPWPPANVSPAGQVTRRFVDAEGEYRAALPGKADKTTFAREEFNRLDKPKLREVMYIEQRSVCVYCERLIAEAQPSPRIEHWRPLSRDHDHALHWKNLYLSCSTIDTCDAAKGERPLRWGDADPHLPWPTELDYQNLLGFTSRGEIYVRNDVNMDAPTRRAIELAIGDCLDSGQRRYSILNLNHPALVAARAAALDSERTRLERDFENSTASREDRDEWADQMLSKNPLPAFVSIRIAWLRKKLGRGR